MSHIQRALAIAAPFVVGYGIAVLIYAAVSHRLVSLVVVLVQVVLVFGIAFIAAMVASQEAAEQTPPQP